MRSIAAPALALFGLLAIVTTTAAAQQTPAAPETSASEAQAAPTSAATATIASNRTPLAHVDLFGGLVLLRVTPGTDLDRAGLAGAQAAFTIHPFSGDGWRSRLGFAAEYVAARRTPELDDVRLPGTDVQLPGTKVRFTEQAFLAGPTVRMIRRERFSSHLRVLVGVARLETSFPSELTQDGIAPGDTPSSIGVFGNDTALAASIGSAWEIRVSRVMAVRLNPSLLITRFHDDTQFGQRLSTGLVFRWYHEKGQASR